jgi:hypothetical protein
LTALDLDQDAVAVVEDVAAELVLAGEPVDERPEPHALDDASRAVPPPGGSRARALHGDSVVAPMRTYIGASTEPPAGKPQEGSGAVLMA